MVACFAKGRDVDKAVRLFERAAEIRPDDLGTQVTLTHIFRKLGRDPEQLATAVRTINLGAAG